MNIKPAELGEAISLGISIILVLSLLAYLVTAIFQRSDNPYLSIESRVGKVVALEEGGYILPLSIHNLGEKTVSYAIISVELPNEEKEIEIEYLPRQSSRDIYVYLDEPYSPQQISAKTSYYKID